MDERNLHQDVVGLVLKCDNCKKVYKTADGLKRHQDLKHKKSSYKITNTLLRQAVEESILKLVDDKCYPKVEREKLLALKVSSEEVELLHNEISHILDTYKGNTDKYYNLFFNYFLSENIFTKKINKLYGTVVALELSTKLLSIIKSDGQSKDVDEIPSEITKNELQGMQYLGGYIFHKLYKKFRNSKKWQCDFNQQCINILLAAQTDKDEDQILNNIRDRGGLWLINEYCQNIFQISETIFREKTKRVTNKIDFHEIVENILKDSDVNSNFGYLCDNAACHVDKEVSLNLLKTIIQLYVRVRSFSHAKDIKEKYQIKNKSVKQKSLRAGLKMKKADET